MAAQEFRSVLQEQCMQLQRHVLAAYESHEAEVTELKNENTRLRGSSQVLEQTEEDDEALVNSALEALSTRKSLATEMEAEALINAELQESQSQQEDTEAMSGKSSSQIPVSGSGLGLPIPSPQGQQNVPLPSLEEAGEEAKMNDDSDDDITELAVGKKSSLQSRKSRTGRRKKRSTASKKRLSQNVPWTLETPDGPVDDGRISILPAKQVSPTPDGQQEDGRTSILPAKQVSLNVPDEKRPKPLLTISHPDLVGFKHRTSTSSLLSKSSLSSKVSFEKSDGSDSDSGTEYVIGHTWMEQISKRRGGIGAAGPNRRLSRAQLTVTGSNALMKRMVTIAMPANKDLPWYDRNVFIEPSSQSAFILDFLRMLFLFMELCLVPVHIIGIDSPGFIAVTYVQSLYWIFDMITIFNTGYIDSDGKPIMQVKTIAKQYLKGRFCLDLMILLVEWMAKIITVEELVTFSQCLKTFRLLRLQKVPGMLAALPVFAKSESRKLLLSIALWNVAILMATHILACGWYGMGLLGLQSHDGSWIDDVSNDKWERYNSAFYFAMSLFHGNPVMPAINFAEKAFTTWVMYAVFVGNIWLVSTITTAMTHLELLATRRSGMWGSLEKWLLDKNVSPQLRTKIKKSAQKMLVDMEENQPESSVELLQLLSDPLRVEIHFDMFGRVLVTHPFFKCYEISNEIGMRKICHTAVETLTFASDDLIFRDGETPSEAKCFFPFSGLLRYWNPDSENDSVEEMEVSSKNWISEGALWVDDWMHLGDLTAKTDCKVLAVDVKRMQSNIISSGLSGNAKSYAEAFVQYINELNRRDLLTDVSEYTIEVGEMLEASFPDAWMNCNEQYHTERKMVADRRGGSVMGHFRRSMGASTIRASSRN